MHSSNHKQIHVLLLKFSSSDWQMWMSVTPTMADVISYVKIQLPPFLVVVTRATCWTMMGWAAQVSHTCSTQSEFMH